jgi:hypothetical protein
MAFVGSVKEQGKYILITSCICLAAPFIQKRLRSIAS